MNDKKLIICLVGESGSGKTTLAERMKKYGYTQVQSYTTRPKRSEDEVGHIFVSKEEFAELYPSMIAYTEFDRYEYGVTAQQIHDNHLYVIDPAGIKYLSDHVGRENLYVIYIRVERKERFKRLYRSRGGAVQAFIRISHDEEAFKDFSDYDLMLVNDRPEHMKYNEEVLKTLLDRYFGGK